MGKTKKVQIRSFSRHFLSVFSLQVCFVMLSMFSNAQTATGDTGYSWDLVNNGELVVSSTEDTYNDFDISFPCVIEVPSWATNRADSSANYYLYFAEHHGEYIRMKWAENITGPWYTYNTPGQGGNGIDLHGVMDFQADSYRFPESNPDGWREDWSRGGGHVAAPDIFLDEENQIFIMAFHGKVDMEPIVMDDGDDSKFRHTNFVAFSKDGLNFNDPETGGGQSGVWGPDSLSFGPLEMQGLYQGELIQRTVNIGETYGRFFTLDGKLHLCSSQGILSRPANSSKPWSMPDVSKDKFEKWWVAQNEPSDIWKNDPLCQPLEDGGERYQSIISSWFASTHFRDHPNNPYPGHSVIQGEAKVNHPEIVKLSEDRFEVYIYIRMDGLPEYAIEDPFRALMRVELDASDPDWNNWEVAKNSEGDFIMDVVCTPEAIKAAVETANGGDVDGRFYADPVSMGVPGVITVDGEKYCFIGFKSSDINPDFEHSEGQIACIKLLEPTINPVHIQEEDYETLSEQSVNIYPNPLNQELLSIQLDGFHNLNNVEVRITNLLGQTVYSNTTPGSSKIVINTNGLFKSSIYLVTVKSGESIVTTKLVVESQ